MEIEPKIIENAQRMAIGEAIDSQLTAEEIELVRELAGQLYCPGCN